MKSRRYCARHDAWHTAHGWHLCRGLPCPRREREGKRPEERGATDLGLRSRTARRADKAAYQKTFAQKIKESVLAAVLAVRGRQPEETPVEPVKKKLTPRYWAFTKRG